MFVALLMVGCGEDAQKKSESHNKEGKKDGTRLTESEVPIELGKELAEMKITKTSGHADGNGTVTVYLTSEEPVKVTLVAKAMNERNQEVGRTTAELILAKDDGKEIDFKFDSIMDVTVVRKYLILISRRY